MLIYVVAIGAVTLCGVGRLFAASGFDSNCISQARGAQARSSVCSLLLGAIRLCLIFGGRDYRVRSWELSSPAWCGAPSLGAPRTIIGPIGATIFSLHSSSVDLAVPWSIVFRGLDADSY